MHSGWIAQRLAATAVRLLEVLLLWRALGDAQLVHALAVASGAELAAVLCARWSRPSRARAAAALLVAAGGVMLVQPTGLGLYAWIACGQQVVGLVHTGRVDEQPWSALAVALLGMIGVFALAPGTELIGMGGVMGLALALALTRRAEVATPARFGRHGGALLLVGLTLVGFTSPAISILLYLLDALLRPPSTAPSGDLAVTALYTNATWNWAKLPGADLLTNGPARIVFAATNTALWLTRRWTRLPPLRCGLVQRHLLIDRITASVKARHILELAAGLSRRGIAISADQDVTYTEVDRPAVLEHKRRLLARSIAGRAALARPNLRFVGADLADAELGPLCTAPIGEPLVVVAEGLCMYLDAAAQRDLWRRARDLFVERPGLLVFDLVPTIEQPRPGRVGFALERILRQFTGGATIARDERTRIQIVDELRGLGFEVETIEPRDAAGLPFPDVQTQQLLFVCRIDAPPSSTRGPSRGPRRAARSELRAP